MTTRSSGVSGLLLLALFPAIGASDAWDLKLAPLPPLATAFGRAPVVSTGVGTSRSAVAKYPSRTKHNVGVTVSEDGPAPPASPPIAAKNNHGSPEVSAPPHEAAVKAPADDGAQAVTTHDVPARRAQSRPPEVCLAFLSCCGRTDLLEATLAAAVSGEVLAVVGMGRGELPR